MFGDANILAIYLGEREASATKNLSKNSLEGRIVEEMNLPLCLGAINIWEGGGA